MRYVLGPSGPASIVRPVAPGAPAAKADVSLSLTGYDFATGVLALALPAYQEATHNTLSEVRVYLLPSGHATPATADAYVASTYPFVTEDVSALQAGAALTFSLYDVPNTPDGDYLWQSVLGFAT